ncbi:hypothetical protein BDW67DRAFT_3545 [Aspergillus spinulosporus]
MSQSPSDRITTRVLQPTKINPSPSYATLEALASIAKYPSTTRAYNTKTRRSGYRVRTAVLRLGIQISGFPTIPAIILRMKRRLLIRTCNPIL